MKFYLYDKDTKEYQGEQLGYIDPLETELRGKDVYLIPPYSTDIEPNLSELKDNEIFVFNGSKWEIQKEFYLGKVVKNQSEKVLKYINDNSYILEQTENGFKICEPTPKEKTINELKAEKLSELKAICHNFDNRLVNNDMYVISSLGFKVNADLRSQNNIKGLIAVNADTVNFVDYNNEVHELTPSNLNTLLIECSKNGENLYMQKWAYAEKIKACKTIEELEKITFDFVMLDFSKE